MNEEGISNLTKVTYKPILGKGKELVADMRYTAEHLYFGNTYILCK